MAAKEIVRYSYRVVPGAGEIIYPLDTTRPSPPVDPVASPDDPGPLSGERAGYIWEIVVRVGDQDVTWEAFLRTGYAGTAGDFELDTSDASESGTGTVAAGTTQPFVWRPSTPDARFAITAGATPPDELDISVVGYPVSQ